MPKTPIASDKFDQLRRQAEALVKDRPAPDPESAPSVLELINELQIHQVELEIQNEELNRTHREIAGLKQEYEDLYEFAPCGYVTLNAKGVITRVNLRAAAMLEQPRTYISGNGFSRFISCGGTEAYQAARIAAARTGNPQTIELILKSKDSSPSWVRLDMIADRNEAGDVRQWRITLTDITAKKEAELALEESRNKYRTLFEAANDAIFVASAETGVILDANQKAERLTGRPRSDFIGMHHTGLHPESQETYAKTAFQKDAEQKNAIFYDDFLIRHADGRHIPVEINPSFVEVQGTLCLLGIFRDVTEKRERMETLQRYEAVIKAVTDPVCYVDRAYNYRVVNHAYMRIPGEPYENIIDHPIWEVMGKKQFESLVRPILDRCFNGEVVQSEDWFFLPDRTRKYHQVFCYPVFDDTGGEVIGASVFIRDNTAQKEAEQALKESEERYRRIVETAEEGIWLVDSQWETEFVNARMAEMLGYRPDEMIGKHLLSFMDEPGQRRARELMARREQGVREQHEFQFRRRDGTDLWAIVSTNAVISEDGQFMHALAMVTDITERKQTEAVLHQTNTLLNKMGKMAKIGGWELDVETQELFWTREIYNLREVVGPYDPSFKKALSFYPPSSRPIIDNALKEAMVGTPYDLELEMETAGGNRKWIHTVCNPVMEGGSVAKLRGTIQDITESKQAELNLKKSRNLLVQAESIANMGSWEWEIINDRWTFSDNWLKIHGCTFEFSSITQEELIKIAYREDAPKIEKSFQDALKGIKPYGLEYRIVRQNDNEIRWVAASGEMIFDTSGNPVKMYGTAQDITARKRAEEKIRQYSERLEEMVEERTRSLEKAQAELLVKERLAVLGHFAGSISHELRNPLAAIDSSAYYLDMISADAGEKVKKHLGRIRNNVKKSTDIIESLLNLSRMEKPNTEIHNLADVVSMSLRGSKVPETVDVRLQFPEEDLFLDIDPAQVRMALKNIVGNAVQAMDGSGKLTLSIQPCGAGFQACQQRRTGKSAPQGKPGSVPQTDATGAVELTIADTGPGIAPEHLEKVFEPLFSTKVHGIGFGLSITRMIIENHGGTIRAESEPGAGAVFVITLPHAARSS